MHEDMYPCKYELNTLYSLFKFHKWLSFSFFVTVWINNSKVSSSFREIVHKWTLGTSAKETHYISRFSYEDEVGTRMTLSINEAYPPPLNQKLLLPLTPLGDQGRISPYNTTTVSSK